MKIRKPIFDNEIVNDWGSRKLAGVLFKSYGSYKLITIIFFLNHTPKISYGIKLFP